MIFFTSSMRLYNGVLMIEKVSIKGNDVWIMIEPHAMLEPCHDTPREYFTASYHLLDPATAPGGILFVERDKTPIRFESPVEALEYANEKLLGMI